MINVKNNSGIVLHTYPINHEYKIKLNKLNDGEKISIFSNAMFMTMFQNEKRKTYSALLASYYLDDITFEELVDNLILVKNELDKNVEKKKVLRSDYVASINGTKLNIEINNNPSLEVMERNIEYAFRLYAKEVNKGNNSEYTQVIQINLNNFSFVGNNKIVDIYTLRNEESLNLTNKIIIVQIYVPNLRKKWYTNGIGNLDESERYILTLVERSIEDSKELGKGYDIMEEYVNDAIDASGDEMLLEAYDKEWALKDLGKQEGYQEGFEEGKLEGFEDGKIAGFEDGKIAGFEDGKIAGFEDAKSEIIRNMLTKNMGVSLISELTGLSVEQINSIENSN